MIVTARFITVDGIDGAGKTTQIELLTRWLTELGHNVAFFRDPGATRLGESIRNILLHREDIPLAMTAEMLLYMASRAQLVQELILPALSSGQTVVCDRFLLANVVYQGSAGGLGIEDLWSIGRVATGGLAPDATIVLDLDAEVALGRVGASQDRLEKRGLEYFRAVRQGFLDQHSRAGRSSHVIDASRSIEEIQQEIQAFLLS